MGAAETVLKNVYIGAIRPHLEYDSTVAYLGFHFGGGFKIFREKWGYLHGAKRHAERDEATRLLGGFGGACSPEKFFKNGAIWCVLESILLKFCQKNNLKNSHFLYKNNR